MNKKLTYCNPLSMEDIKSGRWLDAGSGDKVTKKVKDYRSIADPSVIYHDGKWIMYPSYSVAYVTEDFVHWTHVDIGIPNLRYSPAVVQFRGKWYLSGHCIPEVYVSDHPLGPFTLAGMMTDCHGNEVRVADGCYLADGDRLYFYYLGFRDAREGEDAERVTGTMGVELDPEAPWKFLTEPILLNEFDPETEWQRTGEYHQNERMGWIEGQWMTKIGSRYYLLFSGSGTQYSSYANGVMYSDEGPLAGFVRQKNPGPLTGKRFGLMRGAGHGCITEGPGNTYWIFYTCIFCYNHQFERRIGMDPIGIDEHGELYCPEVTETPQYAPGVLKHPQLGNGVGLLPLTFMQRPEVSSAAPGRDGIYASDDSVLTWWQPEAEDPAPEICFMLGNRTAYRVESMRIIWRDIDMETAEGIMPGPFRYAVEYAPDAEARDWKLLVDASENQQDLCIDYRQFDPVEAYQIRLRILGAPEGITPGLVSLTAFGRAVSGKKDVCQ